MNETTILSDEVHFTPLQLPVESQFDTEECQQLLREVVSQWTNNADDEMLENPLLSLRNDDTCDLFDNTMIPNEEMRGTMINSCEKELEETSVMQPENEGNRPKHSGKTGGVTILSRSYIMSGTNIKLKKKVNPALNEEDLVTFNGKPGNADSMKEAKNKDKRTVVLPTTAILQSTLQSRKVEESLEENMITIDVDALEVEQVITGKTDKDVVRKRSKERRDNETQKYSAEKTTKEAVVLSRGSKAMKKEDKSSKRSSENKETSTGKFSPMMPAVARAYTSRNTLERYGCGPQLKPTESVSRSLCSESSSGGQGRSRSPARRHSSPSTSRDRSKSKDDKQYAEYKRLEKIYKSSKKH